MDSYTESNLLIRTCIEKTVLILTKDITKSDELNQVWTSWNKENYSMIDFEIPFIESTDYKKQIADEYRRVQNAKKKED